MLPSKNTAQADAELLITGNTIELHTFLKNHRKQTIRKNYPAERRPKNYNSRQAIFNAIKKASAFADRLKYHIIVDIPDKDADLFLIRLRRSLLYYDLDLYFTLRVIFHEKPYTIRIHALHGHIEVYFIPDNEEILEEKIKLLEAIIATAAQSANITVIRVESKEHAENIIRYNMTPNLEKNSSTLANIGRRPWAHINWKRLEQAASERIARISISHRIAQQVKEALAEYFGNKLGRTPYFAKLKAGFKWLSWTYFKKDIKSIIKNIFTVNNLPAPSLLL